MPTILVRCATNGLIVYTGRQPLNAATPIDNPVDSGLRTNIRSPYGTGVHCFTKMPDNPCVPLWQTVDLADGDDATIDFA